MRGIRRGPVNFPHKWPVTRKMFPFDDVIMRISGLANSPVLFETSHYICHRQQDQNLPQFVKAIGFLLSKPKSNIILMIYKAFLNKNINHHYWHFEGLQEIILYDLKELNRWHFYYWRLALIRMRAWYRLCTQKMFLKYCTSNRIRFKC